MTNGWLEVIREAVKLPALLSDIYGDLVRPGVKQVGKALETILGLGNTILWPLAMINEKARLTLKRNLERYREQLSDIPEEHIVPVPPELGVPIAEKLAYVVDEQLSVLYINVLAKASTLETSKFAHPGFVNVINCLCPDETVFLREFFKRDPIPFVSVRLISKDRHSFVPIGDLLTGIEKEADLPLMFPYNAEAYVSNIEGLGLISVRRDIFLSDKTRYKELETLYGPQYKKKLSDEDGKKLAFVEGKIDVTPYGRLFMEACLTGLKGS